MTPTSYRIYLTRVHGFLGGWSVCVERRRGLMAQVIHADSLHSTKAKVERVGRRAIERDRRNRQAVENPIVIEEPA